MQPLAVDRIEVTGPWSHRLQAKYVHSSFPWRLPPQLPILAVQGLFYEGWKHPHKAIPDLRYIYEVKLPQRLTANYSAYRWVVCFKA